MNGQKHILLVDDETDLQQLVKLTLQSKGYKVEIANDGEEGLAKLKYMSPNLIILDMNMPKMGGVEFYQKICVADKPKHPVLVLTARANMEKLFKDFNIDGFMAKPFEIEVLLKEVDTIIQKRSGLGKIIKFSEDNQPPKICIADNEVDHFSKIGTAFLNAGFVVNPAQSGMEAIERVSATVPDIALIKLGLTDIAGDLVILKLKKMAKTEDVKFILYTEHTGDKLAIVEGLSKKEGIDRFVAYRSPNDLIDAVNEVLKKETV